MHGTLEVISMRRQDGYLKWFYYVHHGPTNAIILEVKDSSGVAKMAEEKSLTSHGWM